jgi:hypothetical protein
MACQYSPLILWRKLTPIIDAKPNDSFAAEAAVQRLDHHVLKTRAHDLKVWRHTENGFRELQPIDLLCGNNHHLQPLKNGRLSEGYAG